MTEKKLKALFITHDTSNYGASRSLQLLLRNYSRISADIIVQKKLSGRHDHEDLRKRFGTCVNNIWESFLPFDPCYQYGNKGFLFTLFIKLYNGLFGSISRKQVETIIRQGQYDFIHLNSLVLHPLISGAHPFVLHMRDIYDGSNAGTIDSIRKAAGVIFIDEATREPFRHIPLRKSIVLNNPFDMTPVAAYAGFQPDQGDLDVAKDTIFSVIGVASEKKGAGFIIRSFMKFKNDNARLVIVGGREQAALDEYRTLTRNDKRIVLWGEEPDIMKVYAFSDYVLRGEEFPCIGRTVYEGLYAGCSVIIPGDRNNPPPMFEYEAFRSAIFFYAPRNELELLGLFERLTGNKVQNRTLRSNVDAYVRSFHDFVTSLGRT